MPITYAPVSIAPPVGMSVDYINQWHGIAARIAAATGPAEREEYGPLAPPEGASHNVCRAWGRAVALGVVAAAGDKAARLELCTQDDPAALTELEVRGPRNGGLAGLGGAVLDDVEHVTLYIDQQSFGDLIGIHPTYLKKLRSKDRLIEANVKTGRFWGWGIGRAVMWAIEYGYLLPSLERAPARPEMRGADAPTLETRPHWRRELVGYLTQVEVATFLGIQTKSMNQARAREAGPRPAVKIGTTPGWDGQALREYNRRRPVALRLRSQEPGVNTGLTSTNVGESGGPESRT